MPYIVTVTTPKNDPESMVIASQTRKAVTTLEEAHTYVVNLQERPSFQYLVTCKHILALPNGCNITLPDGTVIEVESVSWRYLALESRIPGAKDGPDEFSSDEQKTILDAYNNR